jgi:hypothetical protein
MELDSSLSWLALALTPSLASRLSVCRLKRIGSPDAIFRAPLIDLEGCLLPAPVAQAVFKKEAFKRAEKAATSPAAACSTAPNPNTPKQCSKFTIPPSCSTFAAIPKR